MVGCLVGVAAPALPAEYEDEHTLVEPGTERDPVVEAPADPGPERRRPAPTFFIAELGGGFLLGPEPARLVGGTLGVGGRYGGFPVRFYAIAEIEAMGGLSRTGEFADQTPVRDELSSLALGVGLRLYVPIVGPLRLLAEGTVGSLRMVGRTHTVDGNYEDAHSAPYAALGIGPQFRILHQLSLGARYETQFVDMSSIPNGSAVGLWQPVVSQRSRLLATATYHF